MLAVLLVLMTSVASLAATINVTKKDGKQQEFDYSKRVLHKYGVGPTKRDRIDYGEIAEIATADFDAYERAVKMTSRSNAAHVTVRWTGKGDVNALRLEKLERKRNGAGAARGAGGLLMLLGALSGDRDVYSAGLVTYGAGTIAKDINTEKTIKAQNQAIMDLQAQRAKKDKELEEADSLEAQYRIEYGPENVDGLIALIDGNHERALAFANVSETSDDANYRWSAVWLKAIIYADLDDRATLEKEYDRLIVIDPEISNYEDADDWIELLLNDLQELRQG